MQEAIDKRNPGSFELSAGLFTKDQNNVELFVKNN